MARLHFNFSKHYRSFHCSVNTSSRTVVLSHLEYLVCSNPEMKNDRAVIHVDLSVIKILKNRFYSLKLLVNPLKQKAV